MNTTRQSVIVVAMLLCAATLCAAADRTPLHWAAAGGNEQAIAELLSQGAVPNAVDEHGDTPLHLAARQLRLEAVRLLLAADADANARNAAGQTPLHVVGADARPDVDDADYLALPGVIAQEIMAAGGDPGLLDEHGTAAWPHVAEVPTGDRQPTGYPTYDEIAATLLAWQNTYPSICQRYDLGASSTTKHIYALKISDNVGVEEDEPEMKYISTMHGDEVVGVVMCLNLIELLVTNYGTNPRYTNIIDEMEIWIVPCMNPYGYTYNTRYNASGADLNRSFPEGAPPNPEPNSTSGRPPEVATIMNWSADHSFTLAANFHGGALVVNFPYDNDGSETYYTPDDDLFIAISEEYSEDNLPMWNGSWYHGITRGGDWYEIDGGMQDWSYRYMSCNEVTIELGNTKSPSYSQMPTYWSQNQESMLSYMETCLIGVRGVVTDGSGTPLAATVTVAGRDHPIYTDPDVGDYHRMLLPGTYDLTFETDGYDPITVEDVVVTAGDATVVDVQFVGAPVVTYPNGGELLTAGVPIDVTWVGSPAQQFHVQYTSNFGQFDTTTDDFERTTLGADYTTGGDASWATTSSQAHGGTRSARAGAVTHGQSSWMTRTVGEVQVSFWYYVNSETNYDFFNFYVDASRKIHASGYGSWTPLLDHAGPRYARAEVGVHQGCRRLGRQRYGLDRRPGYRRRHHGLDRHHRPDRDRCDINPMDTRYRGDRVQGACPGV